MDPQTVQPDTDGLTWIVSKLCEPKIHRQNGLKKGAQELARTRRTTRLPGTSRMVRGYLTDDLQ
jgi:hypothetical protein